MIVMWGSNAREAHPIFFHHVLKAINRGAKLYVVDPRRTSTAKWADRWLGLNIGSDIALSNTVAREIIASGLINTEFILRATTGFEQYAESVADWTLEKGEAVTGVPAEAIRDLAHAYARAERAQLCWTLGITEHHNAVDNVLSLINLSLLTGQVGRWGAGLTPLRGQNNVQGGGDMGALPNKLPGFQDIEKNDAARLRFEAAWGVPIQPKYGWHLTQMLNAMQRGELRTLYCIGENPAQSEADTGHTVRLLGGLDFLCVQDMFLTRTAELAHVVLPASAAWCETEGTVTNSERRVQRTRKALDPPPGVKSDVEILCDLAGRLGKDWRQPSAEQIWNELRSLSPMHKGMSYARLEELGGIAWPCPEEVHPGSSFLHGRLWETDPDKRGASAPFSIVLDEPPLDEVNAEYPFVLTTGRRLDSYNTGVQTGALQSPIRLGEVLDISPTDAAAMGLLEGDAVRITSRRGYIVAPIRLDPGLRSGLVFMTFHFPDEINVNILTNEAADPRSGTSEYKAAAVRVEPVMTRE